LALQITLNTVKKERFTKAWSWKVLSSF
jgi:hypothetical protein